MFSHQPAEWFQDRDADEDREAAEWLTRAERDRSLRFSFMVVECSVPAHMTLDEWRRR